MGDLTWVFISTICPLVGGLANVFVSLEMDWIYIMDVTGGWKASKRAGRRGVVAGGVNNFGWVGM